MMNLSAYRKKRHFNQTPEPRGTSTRGKNSSSKARTKKLRFVVQKHDASRLHYDFRLEHDGTLKSWAVPKGPSLDPADKRLAVEVEDHPLEYGSFEGNIPKGEYGAGSVIVWDRGTWEPLEVNTAAEGLAEGKLKFRLHGEKLKGAWMLVRIRSRDGQKNNWLLFKERDEFARPAGEYDITEAEPNSVVSDLGVKEVAAGNGRTWTRSGEVKEKKTKTRKTRASKSKLPAIKPQLATLVDAPPAGDEWLHEFKFDGYRILAYLDAGEARLVSRNGNDWTEKFPETAGAVEELAIKNAILDGEVVAINSAGVSDFQSLQNALGENRTASLVYYVFDLLWLNGRDLCGKPLVERKKLLAGLKLPTGRGRLRGVEHIVGNGKEFFEEAARLGLEGIICKRAARPFVSGRSTDWLKVKCSASGEFVIGGYTDPEGTRHDFGALLIGYHDADGKLIYAGRVGTGFNAHTLRELGQTLRGLAIEKCPFGGGQVQRERRAHWVRPKLVAQIRFSNWTRDDMLRHPAFLGLREDKPASAVGEEKTRSVRAVKANATSKTMATKTNSGKVRAADETEVAGQRITHPKKVLYPDDGITKIDLAEYYLAVAERMMPHVVDRPLSIVRCPDGLGGQRFFQKHPGPGMLESMKRVRIKEKDATDDYVYITRPEDLVALVQVSALEIHPWGSRADEVEKADRLIFDLDPAPDVAWKQVVAAARLLKELLDELELQSFLKTSGGKGLHLCVPITRRHEWPIVKEFCQQVALAATRLDPEVFLATMSKAARKGRIYLDFLRNQRGATSIAAYGTRAKAGAPVSWPIAWADLGEVTSADSITVADAKRRLKLRDPWSGLEKVKQSLTVSMAGKLEKIGR